MQGNVHALEIVFLLLLLFVVVFGVLSKKLKTPYPIVLVVGGLLLSLVPGIPRINLNPDLVFLVILPPLLYSAAWLTSWREFSYNLVSILFLAFGLVTFTVFGVAGAAPWFLSGFDWRMGFVLGAVVAPTDAIAATSIAKRVGLPKRTVDILEGESLVQRCQWIAGSGVRRCHAGAGRDRNDFYRHGSAGLSDHGRPGGRL